MSVKSTKWRTATESQEFVPKEIPKRNLNKNKWND